jgi:hypothetical protein
VFTVDTESSDLEQSAARAAVRACVFNDVLDENENEDEEAAAAAATQNGWTAAVVELANTYAATRKENLKLGGNITFDPLCELCACIMGKNASMATALPGKGARKRTVDRCVATAICGIVLWLLLAIKRLHIRCGLGPVLAYYSRGLCL